MATRLAKTLTGVIALTGDLGSGKTTFVQGFAKGLGIKEKVISPTFVLIRQHQIPNTKKVLYHIDLYRLGAEEQIKHSGIEEILQDPENVILVEWAEKAQHFLPKNTIWVNFQALSQNQRRISLK